MAWRLDREFVNMPIHSCVANVVRAGCMATSSARVMVRVSYVPAAYMQMAVSDGGDVDHRRTLAGVAVYIRSIGADPLFREKLRRPWVGCRGYAAEENCPPRVLYREDGYVRHRIEWLGICVPMSSVWGPNCSGCARRGSGHMCPNCG